MLNGTARRLQSLLEGTVHVFRQKVTLEDAIGSHACPLQANMRVTNGIPLGSSLLLPVCTVNCAATLKVGTDEQLHYVMFATWLPCKGGWRRVLGLGLGFGLDICYVYDLTSLQRRPAQSVGVTPNRQ
jgi:hypothetical protein